MVSLKRESIKIEQYMAVRMREVQARRWFGLYVPFALTLAFQLACVAGGPRAHRLKPL